MTICRHRARRSAPAMPACWSGARRADTSPLPTYKPWWPPAAATCRRSGCASGARLGGDSEERGTARLTPPQPAVSAYSPAGRSARSISLRPTPVSSAPKRVTPIGRRTKANHSTSISRRCPSTIWARPCRITTGTAHTIAPINHMQRNAGYPLRGCLRCDPAPGGVPLFGKWGAIREASMCPIQRSPTPCSPARRVST